MSDFVIEREKRAFRRGLLVAVLGAAGIWAMGAGILEAVPSATRPWGGAVVRLEAGVSPAQLAVLRLEGR